MEKAGLGSALLNSKAVLPAGVCITGCGAIYPLQLIPDSLHAVMPPTFPLCLGSVLAALPLAPLIPATWE